MNILIIEDEGSLAEALSDLLKQNGYRTDIVEDGISGEDAAFSGIYDVILLDIMLPHKNGLDVLKSIRESGISTPVLLLTAKSEIEDKIKGLDSGADDYLTKPFSSGELLARIRALSRRRDKFVGDEVCFTNISLHKNTHELHSNEGEIKLGIKEYQIMEILLTNKEMIVKKEMLLEKVWGYDSSAEYNAAEVYISFLRKKLALLKANCEIKSVRGVGYFLEGKIQP